MSDVFEFRGTAKEELLALLRGQLEQARTALRELSASGGPETLHRLRKLTKKIRALWRLGAGDLPGRVRREALGQMREASALLAGHRESTVLAHSLAAVNRQAGAPLGDTELSTLLDWLRRTASLPAGDTASPAAVDAVGRHLSGLCDLLAPPALTHVTWATIETGFARTYRQSRRAFRCVIADPSVENAHNWRKRSKDWLYQARTLRLLWPELFSAEIEELRKLGECLGEQHDLAFLGEHLRALPLALPFSPTRALLLEAVERRGEELGVLARQQGERLHGERTSARRRRLCVLFRQAVAMSPRPDDGPAGAAAPARTMAEGNGEQTPPGLASRPRE